MAYDVLGVRIDSTDYASATRQILDWAHEMESRYVCAANVHMVMEAYDSPMFQRIVNGADLVTPDGMPLVWMLRAKGRSGQGRVYGPTLMLQVLEAAVREGIPVGFYGGSWLVVTALSERMKARLAGLSVAFVHSPPFRSLTPEEDTQVVEQIRASGARILFVGLGCPKQERWMAEHRGRVPAVMLGVGAAFDVYAGLKRQAPGWIQAIGLEWLFRLFQEPGRLWRRYLYHNPRFVVLAIADLLGVLRQA